MSLFSFSLFNSKSREEKELKAVVELLQKLNSSIANTVAFAKSTHNPEIGLEQSIKDSLYLLDSDKDEREASYVNTSSSYYGRAVTGRLQRLDALEAEMDSFFEDLERFKNG